MVEPVTLTFGMSAIAAPGTTKKSVPIAAVDVVADPGYASRR